MGITDDLELVFESTILNVCRKMIEILRSRAKFSPISPVPSRSSADHCNNPGRKHWVQLRSSLKPIYNGTPNARMYFTPRWHLFARLNAAVLYISEDMCIQYWRDHFTTSFVCVWLLPCQIFPSWKHTLSLTKSQRAGRYCSKALSPWNIFNAG